MVQIIYIISWYNVFIFSHRPLIRNLSFNMAELRWQVHSGISFLIYSIRYFFYIFLNIFSIWINTIHTYINIRNCYWYALVQFFVILIYYCDIIKCIHSRWKCINSSLEINKKTSTWLDANIIIFLLTSMKIAILNEEKCLKWIFLIYKYQ